MEFPAQKLDAPKRELQASSRKGEGNVYVEVMEELRVKKIDPKNPEDIVRALRLVERAYDSLVVNFNEFNIELPFAGRVIQTKVDDNQVFLLEEKNSQKPRYFVIDQLGKEYAKGKKSMPSEQVSFLGKYLIEHSISDGLFVTDFVTGKKHSFSMPVFMNFTSVYPTKDKTGIIIAGPTSKKIYVLIPGKTEPQEVALNVDAKTISFYDSVIVEEQVYFVSQKGSTGTIESKEGTVIGGEGCMIDFLANVDGKLVVGYTRQGDFLVQQSILYVGGQEVNLGKSIGHRIKEKQAEFFSQSGHVFLHGCLYDLTGKKIAQNLPKSKPEYWKKIGDRHYYTFEYSVRLSSKNKVNKKRYFDDQGKEAPEFAFTVVVGEKLYGSCDTKTDKRIVCDSEGHQIGGEYKSINEMKDIGGHLYFIADTEDKSGLVIDEKGQEMAGEENSDLLDFEGELWNVKARFGNMETRVFHKGQQVFYTRSLDYNNNEDSYERGSLRIVKVDNEIYLRWDQVGQVVCYEDRFENKHKFICSGLLPQNDNFLMIAIDNQQYFPVDKHFNFVGEGFDQIIDKEIIDGELYVTGRRGETLVREKVE